MIIKGYSVNCQSTLKEESERQLCILSLYQCCDGLVTKLEYLMNLLAPFVILGGEEENWDQVRVLHYCGLHL